MVICLFEEKAIGRVNELGGGGAGGGTPNVKFRFRLGSAGCASACGPLGLQ